MDVKCLLSYKKLHTQVIIIASVRYNTGCKQVQPKKGRSIRKSERGSEGRGSKNWGQPNLSGSHQLLIILGELEELLIAFPTVDGVSVNEDLIQEITHWFTANSTLKAIFMAADAKMF